MLGNVTLPPPFNPEILQHRHIERRSVGRTLINRNLAFFTGQAGFCSVRDATRSGAGIRLNGLHIIPLDFDLSFDNFRTIRKCRLIWRNGDFVGIWFETCNAQRRRFAQVDSLQIVAFWVVLQRQYC